MTEQDAPTACWEVSNGDTIITLTFQVDMDPDFIPPWYQFDTIVNGDHEFVASLEWYLNHFLLLNFGVEDWGGKTVQNRLVCLDRNLRDKFGLAYNPWDYIAVPPCP